MNIIKLSDAGAEQGFLKEAARVLQQGGLVCFPCHGKYRLAADLNDPGAVTHLLQSKRRVGKAPALVFVANDQMLNEVAAEVSAPARRLVDAFWPGALTILFKANPNLPRKVVKQLVRANGHLGVRVPDDPIGRGIVEAFGGPVLVSSANRENKAGASSPAQVRKNFVHRVDLFVEAGDLTGEQRSTVVEIDGSNVRVTRQGAITEEQINVVLET